MLFERTGRRERDTTYVAGELLRRLDAANPEMSMQTREVHEGRNAADRTVVVGRVGVGHCRVPMRRDVVAVTPRVVEGLVTDEASEARRSVVEPRDVHAPALCRVVSFATVGTRVR